MKWDHAWNAISRGLSASAFPVYFATKRNRDTSGPALNTATSAKPGETLLWELTGPELLTLKAAMIRNRQAAMDRQDCRTAHQIEADIREVAETILRRGR